MKSWIFRKLHPKKRLTNSLLELWQTSRESIKKQILHSNWKNQHDPSDGFSTKTTSDIKTIYLKFVRTFRSVIMLQRNLLLSFGSGSQFLLERCQIIDVEMLLWSDWFFGPHWSPSHSPLLSCSSQLCIRMKSTRNRRASGSVGARFDGGELEGIRSWWWVSVGSNIRVGLGWRMEGLRQDQILNLLVLLTETINYLFSNLKEEYRHKLKPLTSTNCSERTHYEFALVAINLSLGRLASMGLAGGGRSQLVAAYCESQKQRSNK